MKECTFDRYFGLCVYAVLAILLLCVAYPLYFVVIASFSDPAQVAMGNVVLWPRGITLAGYREVVRYDRIWIGYRNSLLYVALHTVLSVFANTMAGYALTHRSLPFQRGIMRLFTVTMFFSGGLIPTYLWVRQLGLIDNPLIVILLGTVSTYNIILARTFIASNVGESLWEAANIDGCSHTRYFFSIVVPLSRALISVLALFAAVGMWNSWFNAMVYLRDANKMPLQMVLRTLLSSTAAASADTIAQGEDAARQALLVESMKYAVIIVSSAPILCLYPFVQRYFVKGMMVGAVKG